MEPQFPSLKGSTLLGLSSFEAFDSVPVPILVIQQDFTLRYANTAAVHFSSGSFRERKSESILSLFSPEDVPQFSQLFLSVFSSSSSTSFSFRLAQSQSVFDLQLSPLFNSLGLVEAVLAIIFERSFVHQFSAISFEELRSLAVHFESTREQERVHISRAIHDEIGQSLTCIGMDLSYLSKNLGSLSQEHRDRLSSLSLLVKDTIQNVRRISSELRPSVLDDLGLIAALEWLASDFESRTQISCHVEIQEYLETNSFFSSSIFRICQEALTNVSRQSQAKHASIHLNFSETNIELFVKDDGLVNGREKMALVSNLETLVIRQKVALLRGSMEIRCELGQGTTLFFRFPSNTDDLVDRSVL